MTSLGQDPDSEDRTAVKENAMRRLTPRRAALLSVALVSSAAALLLHAVFAASDSTGDAKAAQAGVDAASFTESGELLRPGNLDQWVFLGASLGMGYNKADFDPKSPGNFQVVLMEPSAYAHFKAHGGYPNGSMFLLSFYPAEQRISIDRAGFVQGELKNFEIHLLDRSRFAEGRAFFRYVSG